MYNDNKTDCGLAGSKPGDCWMRSLIMTPKFLIAMASAFLTISIFEWAWQSAVMTSLYEATESMWRSPFQISPALFYLAYLVQAFVYAFVVLGLMRTARWCDAVIAGAMLGLMGVAIAIMSYNMMPFQTNDIPANWAAGFFIEAILSALVIKFVNRVMCPSVI